MWGLSHREVVTWSTSTARTVASIGKAGLHLEPVPGRVRPGDPIQKWHGQAVSTPLVYMANLMANHRRSWGPSRQENAPNAYSPSWKRPIGQAGSDHQISLGVETDPRQAARIENRQRRSSFRRHLGEYVVE